MAYTYHHDPRTPSKRRALIGDVSGVMLVLLAATAFMAGCAKEEPSAPEITGVRVPLLPAAPYNYALPLMPPSFGGFLPQLAAANMADNPITNDGATLGRVLFYDRELSANRTTSCGSCHHQENGFADPRATSLGHTGGSTRRNAMHLVNQFYSRRQFWDLRAATLEDQVLMPIQDAVEMGMTLEQVTTRLRAIPHYPQLFTNAFGNDSITSDRVALALAQFVRSIVSYRTRYDQGVENNFVDFTPIEADGRAVFFNGATRCNQCHTTANFTSLDTRNNGLDQDYADDGRSEITLNAADDGEFKVPGLRNVALTAPYMHDGRFSTLEEVVEHYNSGVQAHPNLDDRLTVESLTGGTPIQMNLSIYDKQALVAFLLTLTDEPLIADPRFADPFVQ